ncbi:hypothetical protein [Anaeroselena agilis]|uniref:Uncharacterized protein n=1 Tax=Anaeroselena agilis TaxID=3063788 RepID=A0ABU3NYQ6_9FIRM|nr:hypothetical protein [Selenomonadales bacterium 4137-cl]
MIKADLLAAAMIVLDNEEVFVVGRHSDIQRLSDAALVERAWDLKLDNGHRPYASLKKHVNYDIGDEPGDMPGNEITRLLAARTGLRFAHDLHLVERTYLFRPTAAFWADLWADFSDGSGLPRGLSLEEYFAVYRGTVNTSISNIKFVRL